MKTEVKSTTRKQSTGPKNAKRKRSKVEESSSSEEDEPVKVVKRRKKTKKLSLKKQYPDIKKPRSAFQIYISEVSKHNKAEGIKPNAVEISPKWATIGSEERAKYHKLADEDVLNWLRQISELGHTFTPAEQIKYRPFLARLGVELNSEEENRKLAKSRPTPAFFVYTRENRAAAKSKNSDKTHKEILTILGAQWKALNDDEKSVWKKLALQEDN